MDLLSEMIQQMDKHAVRQFKVYAGRANDDNDRKDLTLFDFIRKSGPEYEDEKAFKKLYAATDKNAYYRLKNRLISDIGRSVFLHQHQNNDTMLSFYYVAMAYYYKSVNVPRVTFYYFRKAEHLAKEIENYGLLDIIFSEMIELAQDISAINPEFYIRKRKENRALMNRLAEVEDILALFEYQINTTQNLAGAKTAIPELLENMLKDYTYDEELKQSPKVQFGIFFIVSNMLLQNKNYPAMVEYLIPTYNMFSEKNFFNKSNHQHKLKMLSWIANAAFMNKNYQLSLQYAEMLYNEMLAYDKMYYDGYELFYYNILVMNFSKINPEKAIALLNSLTKLKSVQNNPNYAAFTYLNLTEMYFILKQFREAIKNLNKAYGHEGFKSMDQYIRLRAALGELMIRCDMKEYDIAAYRVRQISKDFKEFLEKPDSAKESRFLHLMKKISEDPSMLKTAAFKRDAHLYLQKFENHWAKDEVLFKYNEWLEHKL